MWFDETVVYQIYPLGLLGAPAENFYKLGSDDEEHPTAHRILKLIDWADHIRKLGANCVLLNPVFESDVHGYDTRDYYTVDRRLGTNEDLAKVCRIFHEKGLKVMLDGVFNHVGRGFWAFRDVQQNRTNSPYRDWFNISFDGNSPYNDGFWYEGWEGHFELVKLNLNNPAVVDHQFNAIRSWVEQYDIDALRLDVAYCLSPDYLRQLRSFVNSLKADFVLMGETLHGDYNRWMSDELCHSVTNYECYKGLYSSFNSMNMFEIGHSLARQFGPENWTLYKGRKLLNFADNHDVSRVFSILSNKEHIRPLYGILFGMPGVPSVYYGSEWGMEGDKKNGDSALRPQLDQPECSELTEWISLLAKTHRSNDAFTGDTAYRNVVLTNKQIIFERACDSEQVYVAVNADSEPYTAYFNTGTAELTDLLTGNKVNPESGVFMPPYSTAYYKA